MKPTAYKIWEWERKWLSKDMQEIILAYEEENKTLKDKIEFLTSCLDDRDKSIAIMKEELDKFSEAYKKYRDYEKEELAESCYDLARENEKLKEEIWKLVI